MNPSHHLAILGAAALAGCSSVNPPLLFGDESTFGLRLGNDTAAGGSAAEQGAQFTFGYSGRNIAMIPVASLGAGGKVGSLSGQESADKHTSDTYSVFGQFRASTETARLGFGLERFFATTRYRSAEPCRGRSGPDCQGRNEDRADGCSHTGRARPYRGEELSRT